MTKKHMIKTIFSAALVLGIIACSSGPGLRVSTKVGIIEEIRVGRSLAARLTEKYGLVQDKNLTKYLNLIANSIGNVSTRPELNLYVAVLATDEVHAIAAPGGYILLSRGALKQMRSEAEAAFVIGQLIAHVAHRHMYTYHDGVSSTEVERSVDKLSDMWLKKGLSAKQVEEADQTAVAYLYVLGYDLKAPSAVIASLSKASEYASKNPASDARSKAIEAFLSTNGMSGGTDNKARFQAQVRL